MSSTTPAPPSSNPGWWMFHGDPAHTGEITDSGINSTTVKNLKNTFSIDVPGSILSTPAIVNGYVYVGLSNTQAPEVPTGIGGTLLKIDLETGAQQSYSWSIQLDQRDSHSFAGMGCTPAVTGGFIYFMGFDGVLRCVSDATMTLVWSTNLRYNDPAQNQPVKNVFPNPDGTPATPQAAGWSSPVVIGDNLYVGIGEGENPNLYSFVYCIDTASGKVKWIFCSNKFSTTEDNEPNVLPAAYVPDPVQPPFTTTTATPAYLGCSIWAGIAYDEGILYISTGNPQSTTPNDPTPDPGIPTPNSYSYGILALDAASGKFIAFTQFPAGSSYRPTDLDVDVGGAPTLYTLNGRRVVGAGCKNGSYMICDAKTLEIITWRQMLPSVGNHMQEVPDGWIETVDAHGPDIPENPRPPMTNQQSNQLPRTTDATWSYENYQGTYSTAALCSSQQKLFIGIGGNNYHYLAPGIDSNNVPFIRAMHWDTLADAWPISGNPAKYTNGSPPLYTNAGESGISVPAVINDVVFMATTLVALYAFSATDGTLLWSDTMNFGGQTGGFSGGYGYCMGPAVWGDYVVAGALVQGPTGGVLNIYKLQS
ncbi:MAG TPA: hypothetical protein VF432_13280 [Thermoanaerobaculia bacterium]